MAALTPVELEQRRNEMIRQLEDYKTATTDALDEVIASLGRGEYAGACQLMGDISKQQAQTSVKMRAVLVKNGFMVREREDV